MELNDAATHPFLAEVLYLLDTNVVSELRRMRPNAAVLAWLRSVDDVDLHICVVSLGEIQAGVEITRERDASKANEIEAWLEAIAQTLNVLNMDGRAFRLLGATDASTIR